MKHYPFSPQISVCIPVFETEPYLAKCLRSVYKQNFDSFEIIVVSDASRGTDEKKRSAKKIVRAMQKESNKWRKKNSLQPIEIRFVEHHENRGLIEVRRTLCYEACGSYLTQVDSDDEMEEGALASLYDAAKKTGADIVHGTSTSGYYDANDNFIPTKDNRYGKIFYGQIGELADKNQPDNAPAKYEPSSDDTSKKSDLTVFRNWLLEKKFTANTWGKLIKRELWLKAYENIPYTECNMADDVLLFFFLSQYAHSYIGIKEKVYRYRVNTGMSSGRKITTIHRWKMICSAASVFTVISQWLEENDLGDDVLQEVKKMTSIYLANNLKQLHDTVVPELQKKAYELLCEFWGESFVERMEKIHQIQNSSDSSEKIIVLNAFAKH